MTRARQALAHVRHSPDDGNAIVEFLAVALLLLVPTVYLVLVVGRLQSAAFAVDGAAREAVRATVATASQGTPGDKDLDPATAATAAVRIALADQALDSPNALSLTCDPSCTAPQAQVVAHVSVEVPLPLLPPVIGDRIPLNIPVTAHASGEIDTFISGP